MTMRVGAFQLEEPLPDLRAPYAFVVLRPWVDVGNVGSSSLAVLENQFKAQALGSLIRPGNFFDFTRYRPTTQLIDGRREITIPNTFINYARGPVSNDLVFFHLLEPHMLGEAYTESILKVLQKLGIKRYCLIGGMYDTVPHTKPLIVTGTATGSAEKSLGALGVQPSDYEGPTTIAALISQEAIKRDIEVVGLIVHLPQYAQLDEDYAGQVRLLEVIRSLYNFSIDLQQLESKAEEQYANLNLAAESDPQIKEMVEQLETYYEARAGKTKGEAPRLTPEIERFLSEIDKRFDGD